ncbi:GerAB/ArcD/ProY family transporter [Paenibacillus daejeonensis]|uniref:GerAB/ArcD/ProY family transporter n=1 Tax=Paenibacillus daejeonensis TaxID=135193 RepID=UPI0003755357|nr:endospore germination permease [Paenibacillus daejeonensis]
MDTNKISGFQFSILSMGLTVGTSILVIPSGLVQAAREDAWMAAVITLIANVAMVLLYIRIARLFPGQSLFEIHRSAFGKWVGNTISFLYLFYFLMLCGTLLGNLGFFFTSELMPETPFQAVELLLLMASVMCARLGIVILARVVELMLPWILFFALVLILTLLPQVEWQYIFPMWEDGVAPILKSGWRSSMFQELVVMLVFLPMVKDVKHAEKGFLIGTVAGGALLVTVVLLSVLILGIEQSANSTFPAFMLAKTINIGGFLQRVEVMLITLWILTFFIKTSLMFFGILTGMQSIFGLKSYRPLIYPISVLVLVVSWNTYINSAYIAEVISEIWAGYSMVHLLFIPLLVWMIGWFKRKSAADGQPTGTTAKKQSSSLPSTDT